MRAFWLFCIACALSGLTLKLDKIADAIEANTRAQLAMHADWMKVMTAANLP